MCCEGVQPAELLKSSGEEERTDEEIVKGIFGSPILEELEVMMRLVREQSRSPRGVRPLIGASLGSLRVS
jgi:hypothetical protein